MISPFRDIVPTLGAGVFVADSAEVIGDVVLGEDSSVWFQSVVRGDVNSIRIGARTNIQDGCIIHVTRGLYPTNIGDKVTVGHGVILHGCTIGEGCLIGIGARILDDVKIGAWSIVAAGCLILPGKEIPPRSMVMGMPGKVVRELTDEEVAHLDQSWKNYVLYKAEYLAAQQARLGAAPTGERL